MCRGVNHGGRRCPSSKLEGAQLAEHNRRKRESNARRKAIVDWAQDRAVEDELSGLTNSEVLAWAQQQGVLAEELALDPSLAEAGEILNRNDWKSVFDRASTGEEIAALLEDPHLDGETKALVRRYIELLSSKDLLSVALEGDGEVYDELTEDEIRKAAYQNQSLFSRLGDWLRYSDVGQITDAILGLSDFMAVVRPLGAPIRFVKRIRLRSELHRDHDLKQIKKDISDGVLFDVPFPVIAKRKAERELASLRLEILAREGMRVYAPDDDTLVFPPGNRLKLVSAEEDNGELVVYGELVPGPPETHPGAGLSEANKKALSRFMGATQREQLAAVATADYSILERSIGGGMVDEESRQLGAALKKAIDDSHPLPEPLLVYRSQEMLPGLDLSKHKSISENSPLVLRENGLLSASLSPVSGGDKINLQLLVPSGRRVLMPELQGLNPIGSGDVLMAGDGFLSITGVKKEKDGTYTVLAKLLQDWIKPTSVEPDKS